MRLREGGTLPQLPAKEKRRVEAPVSRPPRADPVLDIEQRRSPEHTASSRARSRVQSLGSIVCRGALAPRRSDGGGYAPQQRLSLPEPQGQGANFCDVRLAFDCDVNNEAIVQLLTV